MDVDTTFKDELERSSRRGAGHESHSFTKRLENALKEEAADSPAKGGVIADGEIELVGEESKSKCPISQLPMKKPVRNPACNHVYDMGSLKSLLAQKPGSRCPVVGCPNKTSVDIKLCKRV